ncbi:MAG TPA: EAL domain-containing protein [Emcibacteraceae bacterium]|nr:EAL domain-containing protein [Emcibacteraceae bacterium]
MIKIPDRFLGFSFSVGDILIELNKEFRIVNADGAISEIGLETSTVKSTLFPDLLEAAERKTFKQISSLIKGSNRIGPVNFFVGKNDSFRKKYSIFFGMLPDDEKRIFLVLMSAYRLGHNSDTSSERTDIKEEKDIFLKKVENILSDNNNQDAHLNITLLETESNQKIEGERIAQLGSLLNKYSTGGQSAGQLSDNRFAVIHTKEPDGPETGALIRELTKSTGIRLKSTTIDTEQDMLSEEDGVRALLFSLQQFADGADGFDIESLAQGYKDIVEDTASKVQNLRTILANGDFSLLYQPIVSLKNRTLHHSEALIRFNDVKLRNLQFETICFAEKVGMIQEFDRAIFNLVVKKINQIKTHETPPKIAVNLSGRSLSNKAFLEELKIRLRKNINISKFISLEITESAEITNLKQLSEVINDIREMGFRVYLDDFGARAAGFRYLRELVVDGVKIDGDYIRDAIKDDKTRAFLRSIVTLCNDLNINTIAEWVETEEQAEFLKKLGVTYGQGYLFGRPNTGIKLYTS